MGLPVGGDRGAVGDQDLVGRPVEDLRNRLACGWAVGEGKAEFARHLGDWPLHQVKPGDKAAPAGEPAFGELLKKVGEDGGAAGVVEQNGLGRDAVAGDQGDVNFTLPAGDWRQAKGFGNRQVGVMAGQAGWGEDCGG